MWKPFMNLQTSAVWMGGVGYFSPSLFQNTPKREREKSKSWEQLELQSSETDNGRSAKIPKSLEKIVKVSVSSKIFSMFTKSRREQQQYNLWWGFVSNCKIELLSCLLLWNIVRTSKQKEENKTQNEKEVAPSLQPECCKRWMWGGHEVKLQQNNGRRF